MAAVVEGEIMCFSAHNLRNLYHIHSNYIQTRARHRHNRYQMSRYMSRGRCPVGTSVVVKEVVTMAERVETALGTEISVAMAVIEVGVGSRDQSKEYRIPKDVQSQYRHYRLNLQLPSTCMTYVCSYRRILAQHYPRY